MDNYHHVALHNVYQNFLIKSTFSPLIATTIVYVFEITKNAIKVAFASNNVSMWTVRPLCFYVISLKDNNTLLNFPSSVKVNVAVSVKKQNKWEGRPWQLR
jgi:hypothetical protein